MKQKATKIKLIKIKRITQKETKHLMNVLIKRFIWWFPDSTTSADNQLFSYGSLLANDIHHLHNLQYFCFYICQSIKLLIFWVMESYRNDDNNTNTLATATSYYIRIVFGSICTIFNNAFAQLTSPYVDTRILKDLANQV